MQDAEGFLLLSKVSSQRKGLHNWAEPIKPSPTAGGFRVDILYGPGGNFLTFRVIHFHPPRLTYHMKLFILLNLFLITAVSGQNFGSKLPTFDIPEMKQDDGPNTSAKLIAERDQFVPGETLWLGVELTMKEHWHTYWKNPGDSGMPTMASWDLPEGFSVSEFHWPAPERLILEGLVTYGYEDEAVLQVKLQTSADIPVGETITISAQVDWLECKDVCLPGREEVEIQLTAVEQAPPSDSSWPSQGRVQKTDETGTYTTKDGKIYLEVDTDRSYTQFFPFAEGVWQLDPAPEVRQTESGVEVVLTPIFALSDEIPVPDGLLLDAEGVGYELQSYELQTAEPVLSSDEKSRGVLYYLAFAFIAGMGMNLLPCIFPVLGLKISGFVEQAQGDPKSVKAHALIFAAGVVISLWILGAVVGILGAAWGAQFQDPRVVIGMLLVLTFFTMNLFGVFELGNRLTTVGGGMSQKQGYAGSFFQGVLLTVIGTPCTGPVLAVVIVWMLTQPLWLGFLAFTLMGVGMALPYVALAYSPKLIEKLPRPGTWMITFKKASAFMIVLFLWVLLYVLRGQISSEATIQVVGAMLLVCFAAWVLGTWAAPGRSKSSERIAQISTLLLLILSGYIAFSYQDKASEIDQALETKIEQGEPIRWEDVTPELAESLTAQNVPLHYRPYSPELVESLQAEGKKVFVDFTADWCTICKINKFRALHKQEVMKAFQDKGVVTLRADWTARDPVIAQTLESYGRRGVPVYMMFEGEPGTRAELLPEKLTPEIVLEALDKL